MVTSVLKNTISYDDYLECLQTALSMQRTQNVIKSTHHIVHSLHQTKIALSANDDKRVMLENGIDTMAWGSLL